MKRGFALVEIIVSIAIAAIFLISFVALAVQTKKASRTYAAELRAQLYLSEMIEAAKDLEKSDWDELADGACSSKCHPTVNYADNAWDLTFGDEILDGGLFTRFMRVDAVNRDADGEISETGTDDPNTKKVSAEISWNDGYVDRTLNLETYVFNF